MRYDRWRHGYRGRIDRDPLSATATLTWSWVVPAKCTIRSHGIGQRHSHVREYSRDGLERGLGELGRTRLKVRRASETGCDCEPPRTDCCVTGRERVDRQRDATDNCKENEDLCEACARHMRTLVRLPCAHNLPVNLAWAGARCDGWWFVIELRYFDGGSGWGWLRGRLPGRPSPPGGGGPGGPRAPAAA